MVLSQGVLQGSSSHVIIFKRIAPAQTLLELWQASHSVDEKLEILRALLELTATLHSHGIWQHDLHLQNYLSSNNEVYALDGGSFSALESLSKDQAIDNLASLFSQFTLLEPRNRFIAGLFVSESITGAACSMYYQTRIDFCRQEI